MLSVEHHLSAYGGLDVLELGALAPFEVKRIYWLHSTPLGMQRGLHAHKKLRQVFVSLQGSVKIDLDDGQTNEVYLLDPSADPLIVPPMTWRTLYDFSADSLMLVLASEHYDADDYIHDYGEFQACQRR